MSKYTNISDVLVRHSELLSTVALEEDSLKRYTVHSTNAPVEPSPNDVLYQVLVEWQEGEFQRLHRFIVVIPGNEYKYDFGQIKAVQRACRHLHEFNAIVPDTAVVTFVRTKDKRVVCCGNYFDFVLRSQLYFVGNVTIFNKRFSHQRGY